MKPKRRWLTEEYAAATERHPERDVPFETLSQVPVGGSVNLEVDRLARYAARWYETAPVVEG